MRWMPAASPSSRVDAQPPIMSPAASQKTSRCSSAVRERLRGEAGAFRRLIEEVLGICRDVMGKGEGQRVLQPSNGAERVVDEGLAAIEVAGDSMREAGIDAADDQR